MNNKANFGKTLKCALFSSTLVAGAVVASQATAATADTDTASNGPIGSAMHYIAHNSFVSVGGLHVQYLGNSTALTQNVPAFGLSKTLPGSGSSQSSTTTAEITYGLYLPRTDHHLALQFQLTPPLDFNFEAKQQGSNGYQKIGTFRAFPPNFTAVYRPWVSTRIRPYIGVGATWLNTYDTQVTNPTYKALGANLSLSEPVAFIGDVGADINLWSRLYLNLDFRYIGLADVKSKLSIPANPAAGLPATTISSTNHWKAALYTIGIGWRF
ncbi:OmpW/AlkL family protein [Salinisphaera sp. RV14]|uniref:OmpW/AlkL family protein n=1 Tax=Salinisphaera sp. RV14 TaxID=3454140 RepID=UPI003F86D29B